MDNLNSLIALLDDQPYIKALLVFLLSIAVAKIVAHVIAKEIGRLVKKTRTDIDDRIIAILHVPMFWTIIVLGLLGAISIINPADSVKNISHALSVTLLIIIWSSFTARLLRILSKMLSDHAQEHSLIRPQTLPMFNNIAIVVVVALATYLIFDAWDIDMTAWVASAGIAGIAIGFAAKDTLANLFSGVLILADAPYKIGDYIVLESGERGKVTHIGIRSTRLLTRGDIEITIPNAIMGNTRIINESGGPHKKLRLQIKIGVAYGSDIDQVRAVLEKIATDEPGVCTDPEPRVRFRTFGGSSLDFELLCWVENPELCGRILDALNTTIYKTFMAENIEIPYAKHDIYIKEMPKT